MEIRPFQPLYGPTSGTTTGTFRPQTAVTATNSSATASAQFSGSAGGGNAQLQIANKTSAWAHVNVGNIQNGVTAATVAAGYAVAPGGVVVITVSAEVNGASVILDAAPGTATSVCFSVGEGA